SSVAIGHVRGGFLAVRRYPRDPKLAHGCQRGCENRWHEEHVADAIPGYHLGQVALAGHGLSSRRQARLLLLPRKLLQSLAVQYLAHVHVASGVDPDTMRTPELARCVTPLTAKATDHVARQVANANVILELGDIRNSGAVHVHVSWSLQLGPHVN